MWISHLDLSVLGLWLWHRSTSIITKMKRPISIINCSDFSPIVTSSTIMSRIGTTYSLLHRKYVRDVFKNSSHMSPATPPHVAGTENADSGQLFKLINGSVANPTEGILQGQHPLVAETPARARQGRRRRRSRSGAYLSSFLCVQNPCHWQGIFPQFQSTTITFTKT
jgi:hypothetical protein